MTKTVQPQARPAVTAPAARISVPAADAAPARGPLGLPLPPSVAGAAEAARTLTDAGVGLPGEPLGAPARAVDESFEDVLPAAPPEVAAGTDAAAADAAPPDGAPAEAETRVRDWLAPPLAPSVPHVPSLARPAVASSALARTFAHLAWSDVRLGRTPALPVEAAAASPLLSRTAPVGIAPTLAAAPRVLSAAEPQADAGAAAAPMASLPLVDPLDLTVRRPAELRREAAASARSLPTVAAPRVESPATRAGAPIPFPSAAAPDGVAAPARVAATSLPGLPLHSDASPQIPSVEPRIERPVAESLPRRFEAGLSASAIDPSLFAPPSLTRVPGEPRRANLSELFAEGLRPAALPATPTAAIPAPLARPWQSVGGLAARTERIAGAMTAQAVGSGFGAGDRDAAAWQAAPGVPAVLARLLAGDAATAAPAPLAGALPFLPAPSAVRAPRGAVAASPLALPFAGPRPQPMPSSGVSLAALRALLPGPLPTATPSEAAAPRPESAVAATPASAPRPWLQPGGGAALAELFAAGIGLGSGAATNLAARAVPGASWSALPSWLGLPQAETLSGEPAASRVPERAAALEFVPRARPEAARQAGEKAAPALPGRTSAAAPTATPAERARPTASTAPTARIWQQLGGVAAQSEAFASQHGLPGSAVGVSGAAPAPMGAWLPVSGGMVFLPAPAPARGAVEAPSARASAGGSRPALASSPSVSPSARAAAPAVAAALPGAAPSQPGGMPVVSSPSVAAVAERVAAERSLPWQPVGGIGLRSELFAAGLASGSSPALATVGAAERRDWASAPGVTASLSRALRAEGPAEAPAARWAFGSGGLKYLSAPQAERLQPSTRPQAAVPSQKLPSIVGAAPPAAPRPGSPWQQAGGMATLAELFSAGVSLGSGAAGAVAQQAGVVPGRSLPSWLALSPQPIGLSAPQESLSAGATEREQQASARAELPSLPYLPRDERAPARASVTRRSDAIAASLALPPVLREAPRGSSTVAPMAEGATAASAGRAAAAPSSSWRQAGGLAARTEAFVQGRSFTGSPDSDGANAQGATAADEGRWLPVAGGMVYLPAAKPERVAGGAPASRVATTAGTSARRELAPVSQASQVSSFASRAGGLGLASELFAAGASASLLGAGSFVAGTSSTAATGFDGSRAALGFGELPMLAPATAAIAPQAGRRGAQQGGRLATLLASGVPAAQAAAPSSVGRPGAVPGGLATLAESFSTATVGRSRADESAAVGAATNLWPIWDVDTATGAGRRPGEAMQRQVADRMLTSFPRVMSSSSTAGAASGTGASQPSVLLPTATILAAQVERLSQLLSQLPTDWRPGAAVKQAIETAGAAALPLWQKMPAAATMAPGRGGAQRRSLAADASPVGMDPGEGLDLLDSGEDPLDLAEAYLGPQAGRPTLTLVEGGHSERRPKPAAASTKASAPAKDEQVPMAAMMKQVMQAAVAGNKPAEASLRLMEAMRSHATGQVARSDDRISLGDMTLIAISMGDRRMAAATQGVSAPDVPHVESALRQFDHPNHPEDVNTLKEKVLKMAKKLKKILEQGKFQQGMRGGANSGTTW